MRLQGGSLVSSPTDIANFLACRHKTSLDLRVAKGELTKPSWVDPLAAVLRERGEEHECRYVERLQTEGLAVVDVRGADQDERIARTLQAMHAGADVIVQAALATEHWLGYADVLRKVRVPSPALGAWSYEAHDTKLTRETRAGTILQLCAYSDLLGQLQGRLPDAFRIVTPAGTETYRVDDFAAFYRLTVARFLAFLQADASADTYPEPVEHCDVCRWSSSCVAQRRTDDHLSFVAGLGRVHQSELTGRGISTLETLAGIPVPLEFKPARGAKSTYERLREQARLQARHRTSHKPEFELLPLEKEFGLTQLPEPRPGDLFLDLEGDPFGRRAVGGQPGEGGREYLFGLGRVGPDGMFACTARWAFTDADERQAFDEVMAEIMTALAEDPAIHIYHYAPYEPSTFKRLMGRYAMREADVDRLLRGRRFVDLFAIARHAIRAGVERYSIKNLEPFYGFVREVPLDDAGRDRRLIERALETGDEPLVTPAVRANVEGYNRDDCRSTLELRRWLETLRADQVAQGVAIERPPLEPDAPSTQVTERKREVAAMRARLLDGDPPDPEARTPEQHARYLLAYLIDWHDREEKAAWWEYFRLLELSDADLLDEPAAVAGLSWRGEVGVVKKSVVHRFSYPEQEIELHVGDELKLKTKAKWGDVYALDRAERIIDVLVGPSKRDLRPPSAFAHTWINPAVLQASLLRLAEEAASGALGGTGNGAAAKLLLRIPPRALRASLDHESATDLAVRIVHDLDREVLAIQGPPGSGKTFTAARMISSLLAAGKRVGVVATGHKVIRNLLNAVARCDSQTSGTAGLGRIAHRGNDATAGGDTAILDIDDNAEARAWLAESGGRVLGGTAWLWARPDFAQSIDVLFVDEAGQMSLANALAASQATGSLVLLGDPQQLEQPQKGSHPDGVDVSTLDHVLAGDQTMPRERGLFLPITWRLAPAICRFTSELFYQGKLTAKRGLEHQRLCGSSFDGAGLFAIDVSHDGCRSASDEEADRVLAILDDLLQPGVEWADDEARHRPMTSSDILVVAAYNAQVSRLQERLRAAGRADVRVGTVDKFQGQEAPAVIYSMATSRPEDAPRGMEFLYSLNRLNVATSRARCACILVASPRLFAPDCRTPRQMRLANALARFRELSAVR
jgi:uncharacterized protein